MQCNIILRKCDNRISKFGTSWECLGQFDFMSNFIYGSYIIKGFVTCRIFSGAFNILYGTERPHDKVRNLCNKITPDDQVFI